MVWFVCGTVTRTLSRKYLRGPPDASSAEQARDTIREATRLLARIEDELGDLIAERRGTPRPGELAPAELTALQQNVR